MREKCMNCGAPLVYVDNGCEGKARCDYCRTEYHVDRLGRVEEYKVKLQVMGKIREFYISDMTVDFISKNSYRNINGQLINTPVKENIKLNLIEV